MTRAVVFAYHRVGVRCLKVLLAHGIDVCLVVTHRDNPDETIWFDSVADTARDYGIETILPEDPNAPAILAQIAACRPDFLFSFYFRKMLAPAMLALPPRGAFNMHGSLLPHYRGRVPVNWAILHGERQTGATLHAMTEKPDKGAIVDQQAVPILPDDSAIEVFEKVVVAAEIVLDRCLPTLVTGTAAMRPQDPTQGSYFGGRSPQDGRIDWRASAAQIHNLVRAVAPPYPGAFTLIGGKPLHILRTLPVTALNPALQPRIDNGAAAPIEGSAPPPGGRQPGEGPALFVQHGNLYARCADGRRLRILAADFAGEALDAASFERRFGPEIGMAP